ncbi:B-cell receptor CD22-like [Engraulis encrasicolus]|uniref:B-cell receptor CD22-like n=1 Tax=Engraulis encrasicolus TaxID=184585 RepID=UPI002FD676BB
MTSDKVTEGEIVTLMCNTTCSLPNNPTFTWYKNGQPLLSSHTTRDNTLLLNPVSSEDSGSYYCAVGGHDNLSSPAVILNVRYKPKNAVVFLNVSGEIIEGASVTLTCSSDANPPVHNYTWYMKTGADSLTRGSGESISFNVTSDTSGLYYCQAHNEVGSQTSADIAVQKGYKQSGSGLLCGNVATRAVTFDLPQTASTQDQDDVQYSSVRIKHSKPQTTLQDDSVTYASVQFNRGGAATSKKKERMTSGTRATHADLQTEAGLHYDIVGMRTMTQGPQQASTHGQDDVQYSRVRIKRPKPQTNQQDDSITYA